MGNMHSLASIIQILSLFLTSLYGVHDFTLLLTSKELKCILTFTNVLQILWGKANNSQTLFLGSNYFFVISSLSILRLLLSFYTSQLIFCLQMYINISFDYYKIFTIYIELGPIQSHINIMINEKPLLNCCWQKYFYIFSILENYHQSHLTSVQDLTCLRVISVPKKVEIE